MYHCHTHSLCHNPDMQTEANSILLNIFNVFIFIGYASTVYSAIEAVTLVLCKKILMSLIKSVNLSELSATQEY